MSNSNEKNKGKNGVVKFNLIRNVFIPIVNEIEWVDDYAIARRGNWVTDAQRFKDRINRFEKIFIPPKERG